MELLEAGKNSILPYVPALVYTLYDGYYIYSPMKIINDDGTESYEHVLKPYVYYSARYYKENGKYDFIVNYSLDNYVVIYGTVNNTYVSKAGYLTVPGKYNGYSFKDEASSYLTATNEFTAWVNTNLSSILAQDIVASVDGNRIVTAKSCADSKNSLYEFKNNQTKIFNIATLNDPEVKTSDFTEHKNNIIIKSIEKNLQDAINNYTKQSQGLGTSYDFKMPILSATEWDKVLSKVSMISFLQGLQIGYKSYNNYMIVSSNGNYLTADPEDMYFVTKTKQMVNGKEEEKEGTYYHKINCPLLATELQNTSGATVEGFKNINYKGVSNNIKVATLSSSNEKIYIVDKKYYKLEDGVYKEIPKPTEVLNEYDEQRYTYNNHTSLACYECIVSPKTGALDFSDTNSLLKIEYKDKTVNNSISTNTRRQLREAYYNALFRERFNLVKVSQYVNKSEN